MDEVLGEQYAKGEIAGIRSFVAMPQTVLDTLQTTIEQLINERNADDETE